MFRIYTISKDTYISRRDPEQNQGRSSQLYIVSGSHDGDRALTPHDDRRTLIGLDAQSIISDIGSASVGEYTFRVRFMLSDLRLAYNDFGVNTYALVSSWQEGIGDEFNTNVGATWEATGLSSSYLSWDEGRELDVVDSDKLKAWGSEGGDYSGSLYPTTLDTEQMIMETDISEYVYGVNSGSINDHGLIYIASKPNYNLAMYSLQSDSELSPYVVAYKDDYNVNTGSADLFTGDSYNMYIKPVEYTKVLTKGEEFFALHTIESKYRRAGFTYEKKLMYVENLKYRIVYNTTQQEFVPLSDYTKVSVKGDGLTTHFSTENFPRGSYYIQYVFEDTSTGTKQYSEKFYFRVE